MLLWFHDKTDQQHHPKAWQANYILFSVSAFSHVYPYKQGLMSAASLIIALCYSASHKLWSWHNYRLLFIPEHTHAHTLTQSYPMMRQGRKYKGWFVSNELRGNISPFPWVGLCVCVIVSICFSISTTAVMISATISLICENSLAVLTTAKTSRHPSTVLQPGLWGSILLWPRSASILKLETDDVLNKTVYLSSEKKKSRKIFAGCWELTLIAGVNISAVWQYWQSY